MKVVVLIFILVIPFNSFGQQPQSDSIHSKVLQDNSIPPFLDSLKTVIFQDTSKFNRADLIHTNMGTRNIGSYSPVFLINMKYSFKLDIINGTLVNQFVNNILDPSKIVRIDVMDTIYSQALLGVDGINGAIWITTKKNAKIDFNVAGLKMSKNKKHGDNFDQRQGNEIKILY